MNSQEIESAFEAILEKLRGTPVQWITSQVQDQIQAGKPVVKEVSPVEEDKSERFLASLDAPSFKGRRQSRAATEEYSPQERLVLLLNAIEAVVVESPQMEGAVLENLGSLEGGVDAVRFLPERFEEEEGFAFSRTPEDPSRESLNRDIKEMIQTLEKK